MSRTLNVQEDEWWPWYFFAEESSTYDVGTLDVDEETAERWIAGIKAAEALQREIADALNAKHPTRPRS